VISFSKSSILSLLTQIQIEKISQNAKIANYKPQQIVFNKNDLCDQLVIVLEGSLVDSNTNTEMV
jgi:cGMP-dependent protein kinase